jgi:hypothetical protein
MDKQLQVVHLMQLEQMLLLLQSLPHALHHALLWLVLLQFCQQ